MRTPSWETSAGALAAHLNAQPTQGYRADLYTITLSGGSVLRWTNADHAVTLNGNTWALGPVITRGRTALAVGVAVDSLDITLAADSTVTVNGAALMPFIAAGGLDGARLLLERAYASAPPVWGSLASPWVGTLALFQGRVGVPSVNRYQASLQVNSDAELLNVMVPRNVYQPACTNTLFDSACGISKAANANSISATGPTDSTRTQFASTASSGTDWALGFVVGVAGANAGISRAVRSSSGGALRTIQPWPKAVAPGDTFTLYPGCDKTMATCAGRYSNLLRFRGHPFVPAPETIT